MTPVIALCVLGDESKKALVGHFRVVLNGPSPLRFDIKLEEILKTNPLPEINFTLVIDPKAVNFKENSWFTPWESLNEDIMIDNISISPSGASEKPLQDLRLDARRVMAEPGVQVSYRFEVTQAPAARRMVLLLRYLPAHKDSLNGHTRLDGFDVSTIAGGEVLLTHLDFPPEMKELDEKFIMAPFLFSSVSVNEDEYREMME